MKYNIISITIIGILQCSLGTAFTVPGHPIRHMDTPTRASAWYATPTPDNPKVHRNTPRTVALGLITAWITTTQTTTGTWQPSPANAAAAVRTSSSSSTKQQAQVSSDTKQGTLVKLRRGATIAITAAGGAHFGRKAWRRTTNATDTDTTTQESDGNDTDNDNLNDTPAWMNEHEKPLSQEEESSSSSDHASTKMTTTTATTAKPTITSTDIDKKTTMIDEASQRVKDFIAKSSSSSSTTSQPSKTPFYEAPQEVETLILEATPVVTETSQIQPIPVSASAVQQETKQLDSAPVFAEEPTTESVANIDKATTAVENTEMDDAPDTQEPEADAASTEEPLTETPPPTPSPAPSVAAPAPTIVDTKKSTKITASVPNLSNLSLDYLGGVFGRKETLSTKVSSPSPNQTSAQPKTAEEEEKLKEKYAQYDDVGERAFHILLDLGMIEPNE